MTRDDIIRMARSAFDVHIDERGRETFSGDHWCVEELAALVAAHEREACARFLESGVDLKGLAGDPQMQAFCGSLLMECAKVIRARGEI